MEIIEVAGKRYQLASPMERWLGQVLDGVIYIAIILILSLLIPLVGRVAIIIGFIIAICYLLFQDGLKNGQSFGKRIVKTKVMDARSGLPCTFGQSFVRNLLLSILGFIDWIFIVGAKKQRLGDKAASTLVVKVTEVSEGR